MDFSRAALPAARLSLAFLAGLVHRANFSAVGVVTLSACTSLMKGGEPRTRPRWSLGSQHKSSAGLINNFLSFVFPFIGKTPEAGAVPALHLASADIPAEQGGAVFTEDPKVRLFKTPAYMTEANRDAAFAAINAVLRSKGRAVPFQ